MSKREILADVNAYYTDKVMRFGNTPQGVDWNSADSQHLRFKQLTRILPKDGGRFSIFDFGCGWGSLYQFLKTREYQFKYHGYDISDEMIERAKANRFKQATWSTKMPEGRKFDYAVASGIFNVKLKSSNKEWQQYAFSILDDLNKVSEKGFSFNMLTSYSDKPYMKKYLYYADPRFIFDYCKTRFSKHVALLHDYPLYEFSVLVRKDV